MKIAGVVVATALALALQTTLARFLVRGTAGIDLVLVVVVYAALSYGPVTGLVTGTFAGLLQDALSSGIIGIGGLAKTVVGFVAGVDRDAVHRRAVADPVRGVLCGERAARGAVHRVVRAARPARFRRALRGSGRSGRGERGHRRRGVQGGRVPAGSGRTAACRRGPAAAVSGVERFETRVYAPVFCRRQSNESGHLFPCRMLKNGVASDRGSRRSAT